MRAPTRPKALSLPAIKAAIALACARSSPTGAPSSQSQAMSKTGPISRWSDKAFRI